MRFALEAVSEEKDKPADSPHGGGVSERVTVPEGMESVLPTTRRGFHCRSSRARRPVLFLIKREKIDIQDIPIAHHAQYMELLDPDAGAELDVAGAFMVNGGDAHPHQSKMLVRRARRGPRARRSTSPREELVRRLLEFSATRRRRGSRTSRPDRAAQWTRPGHRAARSTTRARRCSRRASTTSLRIQGAARPPQDAAPHEVEARGRPSSSAWTSCWDDPEGESLEFLELSPPRDEGELITTFLPAGAHPPQAGAGSTSAGCSARSGSSARGTPAEGAPVPAS